MAEVSTEEGDMLLDKTETESETTGKLVSKKIGNEGPNGESKDEKSASVNGLPEDHTNGTVKEKMEAESDKKEDRPLENGNAEKMETSEEIPEENDDTQVVLSDKDDDSNVDENFENAESPVIVNSDASNDEENSSEAMEVDSKEDDDSNIVEVSSIASAPNSEVIELDDNDSNNPSLISEDSSRDSIVSGESIKTGNSSDTSPKDGLVGTVKVDDGDEILITLNDEEEVDKEKADDEEKNIKKITDQSKSEIVKTAAETKKDENSFKENVKLTVSLLSENKVKPVPITSQSVATVSVSSLPAATNLLFSASTGSVINTAQNFIVQNTIANMPSGGQLVRQGNQFGYISIIGNQHVFVPVSTSIPATVAKNPMIASQLTPSQQQKKQEASQLKAEDLKPKSSWEMIELMKWEIQNRVPDNYNWSVAYHGRKEELSSISSFLQELGSDVVKEQVYKDIIQIQTKKKKAGDLKEQEIDSLEKMKTVYENTKKKVEHLQLETKECGQCKFKTESDVILNYHKDFPHYDPPWDVNRGWLMCAHCDFKTKTGAHYVFHEKDIHNVQAKFLDKDQYFQCSLCPMNASTKNKLEKHQQKCMKHFKLNANLQPYYHDVNFCMKTCFYKPKKVLPKPQPPQPPKPAIKPTMMTRQNISVPVSQTVIQQNQPIRPNTNVAIRQRLPIIRSTIPQPNIQRPQIQQPRPRLNPPALQRAPVPQQKPVRPPGKEMSGFEVCELCGGYVKDRQALRIHFYYAHKVEMPQAIFNRAQPPLMCDVCKTHFWTTQGLSKHKTAQRHFIGQKPVARPPTVSGKITTDMECFMCLKRFPNLFVHFEKIHGMTMKDLVLVRKCIMCGLATSDYRNLETHLVNVHGILIKVNDYITDKAKPVKPNPSTAVIGGGKNVGKINYCVFCQIQFPDNIQLTMHCIKIHATCRTCGMVVCTNKHLVDHSCRKAHINRSCYICGTIVTSQENYAIHLRSHVKPCRVKIENLSEDEIREVKEKIKREYKPAVISLDSDEDSDVEVVETKPSKMKVVLERDEEKDVEMVDLSEDADTISKSAKNESELNTKKEVDGSINSEKESNQESCEIQSEGEKLETSKHVNPSSIKDSENEGSLEKSDEIGSTDKNNLIETEGEGSQNNAEKSADDNLKVEVALVKGEESIDTKVTDESPNEIKDEVEESDKSGESSIKSNTAEVEELDEVKHETAKLAESEKTEVDSKDVDNKGSVENEAELEERLLAKDDDDLDSVLSSGSRKRKKSDSDIDEEALLKDEDDDDEVIVKRMKVESVQDDVNKSVGNCDVQLEKEQNEEPMDEIDDNAQDCDVKPEDC